jgi:hypothetical protein
MGKAAMAENIAVRDAELERQHVGVRQHGEDNSGKQQAGRDNFTSQA